MYRLYDYQVDLAQKGLSLLQSNGFVYLVMEIRTGKTPTSLQIACSYGATNVLFITKKKAIKSIEEDYEKFGYNEHFQITVINYESVQKAVDNSDSEFDFIVLDESHGLGAFPKSSKRQKAIRKICKGLPIIFLSGTPSPESYSQLFHQLQCSSNSPWKEYSNFYKWCADFVDIKQVRRGQYIIKDYSNARDEVQETFKSYSVDYTQSEAGFNAMPSVVDIDIKVDYKIHQAIEIIKRDKVLPTSKGEYVAETPASELSAVHQLSGGTLKLEEETLLIDTSKTDWLKENLRNYDKVAIIYKFVGERDLLLKELSEFKVMEDVEEFRDSTHGVFIGQYQSCAFGVNLSTANCQVLYNADYSSATAIQILGRLQTKSRKEDITVYRLCSDIGIEKHIYEVLNKKKKYTYQHYNKWSTN